MSNIHRRKLLTGLLGLVAAPAIVRATSIMQVSSRYMQDGRGIMHGRYLGLAPLKPEGGIIGDYDGSRYAWFLIRGYDQWNEPKWERIPAKGWYGSIGT